MGRWSMSSVRGRLASFAFTREGCARGGAWSSGCRRGCRGGSRGSWSWSAARRRFLARWRAPWRARGLARRCLGPESRVSRARWRRGRGPPPPARGRRFEGWGATGALSDTYRCGTAPGARTEREGRTSVSVRLNVGCARPPIARCARGAGLVSHQLHGGLVARSGSPSTQRVSSDRRNPGVTFFASRSSRRSIEGKARDARRPRGRRSAVTSGRRGRGIGREVGPTNIGRRRRGLNNDSRVGRSGGKPRSLYNR